jgi:CRISPR-associated protein Csb3
MRVNVDPTNPGQFFACCGLLEIADRLWRGAEGWFENEEFCIACSGTLFQLLSAAATVKFAESSDSNEDDDGEADDEDDDDLFQPLQIISPVQLRLDWWADKSIKTWAGSMNVNLIAVAMCYAIDPQQHDPFNQIQIVYDPPVLQNLDRKARKVNSKKREPFYFDARRAPNAHPRDVGFSPNDLKMTTAAAPAVEFLCLIGLQRCRPARTSRPRVFDYFTWAEPLPVSLLPPAVSGLLPGCRGSGYRFENWFRSGQKKLKAYRPAILLNHGSMTNDRTEQV